MDAMDTTSHARSKIIRQTPQHPKLGHTTQEGQMAMDSQNITTQRRTMDSPSITMDPSDGREAITTNCGTTA